MNPMLEYIQQFKNVEMYIGIRRDESKSRAQMTSRNFDGDYYGCWVNRPLIAWSAQDCFDIIKKYDIEPNPLYKLGMKRVGCMPCIMSSLPEMTQIIRQFPEVILKLKDLENKLKRTFCPPGYIPDRFCSQSDEEGNKWPTIDDVVKYLQDDPDQIPIFGEEPPSCMSVYNICE